MVKRPRCYNFFLQETHSTADIENTWKDEWGSPGLFFSHGNFNSRGTCILFRDFEQFQIKKQFCDKEGRIVMLDIGIVDTTVTLINIYAPNTDDAAFFDSISLQLEQFECQSIIWGGDFNCVLDLKSDKKGGRSATHSQAVKSILNIMEEFSLIDVWRMKNPTTHRYTWHSKNVHCRLDFFLISFNLISQVKSCNILLGYKTDHSAITCKININSQPRGRGLWKFNVSLFTR